MVSLVFCPSKYIQNTSYDQQNLEDHSETVKLVPHIVPKTTMSLEGPYDYSRIFETYHIYQEDQPLRTSTISCEYVCVVRVLSA